MYSEKELSTYLQAVVVRPSDREMLPQPDLYELCAPSKVGAQTTPRDPVAHRTVQPSKYSSLQLYVAMASHSKWRIRRTNQDVVFLLPSKKRNQVTICRSQARANLKIKQLN
jgi:hypothetical protein